MQPLVHPGPTTEPRIIAQNVATRRAMCVLTDDRPLIDQLHETLAALGTDSGFAEIHGGDYAPLSYCVPDVATAEKALSFSETREHDAAHLMYGSVTLGVRDGAPYMHSHCFWQTTDGTFEGGHVWLETEPGHNAPFVVVTGIYGAQWQSTTDPETHMPVFTPVKRRSTMYEAQTAAEGAVIARVLPNIDITDAVLRVCREAGYETASVRAGLGSFVGATFIDRATGQIRLADGPATEVIALVGDVRTIGGELAVRLTATLVDRHGVIHAGELVPGENLVAATFELTIQRIDTPAVDVIRRAA